MSKASACAKSDRLGSHISARNNRTLFLRNSTRVICHCKFRPIHSHVENFFFPQLQQFEGYNRATWFQQDGATCHTSNASMAVINEMSAGKLTSRRGDIAWPPRSPDLTPPDFFMWGYLKSRVYSNNPATINQLKTNIQEEMTAIPRAMCQRVFTNLRSRFEECLQRDGAHLEDVIFKE